MTRAAPRAGSAGEGTRRPAGLLLTGGASRRMGFAKGELEVEGVRLSRRLGDLLASIAQPSLEVGPGYSGLSTVTETITGRGPMTAIVAGWEACRETADPLSIVVLACDLPFMTLDVLRWLASRPGHRSMVPLVGGRAQPLCARWSAEDVEHMSELLGQGHRSFKALYGVGSVTFLDESSWGAVTDARAFADADTSEDLVHLGLARTAPSSPLGHQR